jgi:tRNA (uracil-5-)-methyltransferase TRM9
LADVGHLPYPDESFDRAISVATYHHIEGKEERLKALVELRRVLKPGGEAFITVWNRWQPRFWFKPKEVFVPWRKKGKTLYRYYYLFSYAELEKLARSAGFQAIKYSTESTYRFPLKLFSRNICLLVKKSD